MSNTAPTGPQTPQALEGLRVLEVAEGIAGPFAARLLADHGAEVVKIEPPGRGDRTRHRGPFAGDVVDPEGSGLFHYLNAGKLSVILDLNFAADRARLVDLAATVDVLVASGSPDLLAGCGIDVDALTSAHPGLVVTTITPFGLRSTLSEVPMHDVTYCALGGLTTVIGEPHRPPLTPPLELSGYQAGLCAASASLLAVLARDEDGLGQHVDISPLDAWATVHQGSALMNALNFGRRTRRAGRRRREAYPFHLLEAKDGLMCLIARDGRQWKRFVEDVVGDPALSEERYRNRLTMGLEYPDEVDALLQPWFAQRTRDEIFGLCRQAHIPFSPVRTVDEVAHCEQLAARDFFVSAPTSAKASHRGPGLPWRMSGTPWRRGAVPRLGEHTGDVLPAVGHAAGAPAPPRPPPGTTRVDRPLTGFRVLDLSWVLAGPVVGRLMADAGAEVLKVESARRMDNTRLGRPLPSDRDDAGADIDRVPLFHTLNAGKRSVAVDLRAEGAAQVVKDLARHCDVVVENFAPGVADRLGIGYAALREVNPDLVMLSMSGTGSHGPMSDVPAYAPTVTALAGLDSLVGYDDGPAVGLMGANLADSLGGLYGLHALLTALVARRRLGRGQWIDYSEMDGVCTLLAEPLMDYFLNDRVPEPAGSTHPTGAPYGVFPAVGDDRWVAIAVTDQPEWGALVHAAHGQPWTSDARFSSVEGRLRHHSALDEAVATWTRTSDRDELVTLLRRAGVPTAPVYEIGEQREDAHFWERGLLTRIDGVPGVGETVVYGSPWSLARTPTAPTTAGPALGADTAEVLRRVAGYDEQTIESLQASGVVA